MRHLNEQHDGLVQPSNQVQREDKVNRLMERNGIPSRKKEENDDRLTELEKVVQDLKLDQGSNSEQESDTLTRLTEVERALSILLSGKTESDSEGTT